MGWSSYCIRFENDRDMLNIFDAIREHNNTSDYDSVGEELMSFGTGRFRNMKIFLCGNGGGSMSTIQFLRYRGLFVMFYDDISEEITDKIPRSDWDAELRSRR